MKERDVPYGNYAETIPMEKLIELTRSRIPSQSDCTDELVRKHAKQVVEEELSPEAQSSDNIVDALVEEILRKRYLMTGSLPHVIELAHRPSL